MITMKYHAVRDALVTLLGDNQGTSWDTIGYLQRDQSAKQNNEKKTAQVYYNSGDFQRTSSAAGPIQHNFSFHVILTVAEKAKGDVSGLDNAATEAEYLTALTTFTQAEYEADRQMDDFISEIWLLITGPQNRNLGLDLSQYPRIGSRWIPNVKKEQPKRIGSLCTMRSMMTITGLIPEDTVGIQVGQEMIKPEITGDNKIKGNEKQSGFEEIGEPAP